jgi:OOP family OmpA-OmpF porin
MKKLLATILVFGMVSALLFGCAGQKAQPTPTDFTPVVFSPDEFDAKVSDFVVVFDASSSMTEVDAGYVKFELAKAVVDLMGQTVPELGYNGALRAFGHSTKLTRKRTMLFYGLSEYVQADFKAGLDGITRAGGTTPMTAALAATQDDLAEAQGQIAVVVVSDGKSTDQSPVAAAEALKAKFGEQICIYTILVGDDEAGMATMDAIVEVGGCGFASNATDLLDSQAMGEFVEKVFLQGKEGCPDADGDGVCDDVDQCPGTPQGARVGANGCWIIGEVLFDFDKSVVKPEWYQLLDEVTDIMNANSGLRIILEGHTDSIGSESYNMGLSKRRAEAVKAYLEGKGISPDRLASVGYGEEKPVADNSTKEGRALNRRTELTPEL